MQLSFVTELLQGAHHSGLGLVAEIAFNPIKLFFLVVWVYMGLFFVQRVEFSMVVPKERKPIINVLTLILGPIPLMYLFIADALKTPGSERGSLFEAV
jgi:hypothetical protein